VRALTISGHGGFDVLELRDDLPVPELRSSADVRVRVRAAALNHLDLFMLGGLPGITIKPPWPLASDACGVIDAVGSEVKNLAVGDFVVVNERQRADNGEMVIALLRGSDVTLKKFYRDPGGKIRLQPANTTMQPMRFQERDVLIQGVVVGVIRKY